MSPASVLSTCLGGVETDPAHHPVFCQERIQALEVELQSVSHSKAMLDKELQEVITQTNRELQEQREKVVQLQDEVGQPHGPGAERLEGQSLACALGRLL